MSLERVLAVYDGSDGDATMALYADLAQFGALGNIAINLFRAQKNSSRAKVYRGRGYRDAAYDRKQWAMDNLVTSLFASAPDLSMRWGWGTDPTQSVHNAVLYVDLPTGQVSFHTGLRGIGPDYPGEWDGRVGQSPDRIIRFVVRVLASGEVADAA
jgi:hypothetical protein